MQAGGDVVELEPSFTDGGEQQGQCRFQARETGRRRRAVLLLQGVGGVVGGEAIDGFEVLPQGPAVGGGGQRRPDAASADAGNVLFPEEQVMRADLTGHRSAPFLVGPDQLDLVPTSYVAHVDGATEPVRDLEDALHRRTLGMNGQRMFRRPVFEVLDKGPGLGQA